ncbi:MAG: hypothetical protein C0502_01045 [Opitutus sp.]|nr:hypothetical protein [Opitutus sp.]
MDICNLIGYSLSRGPSFSPLDYLCASVAICAFPERPMPRVSGLFIDPVKSCRGHSLRETTVDAWGFVDDRRYLVVSAADGRFRLGDVEFRNGWPCAHCVVTTTDQETAERGKEPLRTLATFRRDPRDPTDVNFGINLVHETKCGTVLVGDGLVPLPA